MGLLHDLRLPILDLGLQDHNPRSKIAGVAYGSYARVLLSPILDQLAQKEVINTDSQGSIRLEDEPELLWEAVRLAHALIFQIKSGR
jgi:hypothetical protein